MKWLKVIYGYLWGVAINLPMKHVLIGFSIIIVLTSLILLSIGQTARWDILDHISMVDHFYKSGSLYPKTNSNNLSGVSVYFPGMSFIGLGLNFISSKYLIQLMQIFSISMIFTFYRIQLTISKELGFKGNDVIYYLLSIISYFFLNYEWLVYASECKPDIVAFNCGSLGVILYNSSCKENNRNLLKLFFGIFFTGIAILFKQQYLFFLLGLVIYSVFFGDKYWKIFTLGALLVAGTILLCFFKNSTLWFWTVTVLKDDGLLSIKQVISDHILIGFYYLSSFIIAIVMVRFRVLKFNSNLIFYIRRSPWITIFLFVAIGGIISALKVGGNAGNTAFGMVIILPIIISQVEYINIKYLLVLTSLVLLFRTPKIINSSMSTLKEINEMEEFVKDNIKQSNLNILTGSNLYFCSRSIQKTNFIDNYWSYAIRDNSVLDNSLANVVGTNDYDFLIVENYEFNYKFINSMKNYKVVFHNDLGIIVKKL